MDGWTGKDSGLRDQKRLHERGRTELCFNVWREWSDYFMRTEFLGDKCKLTSQSN